MKKIATLILEDKKRGILLYLRDNKPTIPFPHHWDLFGGHVEDGESVEGALRREVKEELNLDLDEFHFFKKYDCKEGDAMENEKYVYYAFIDKELDELTLLEGEKLQYFSRDEIPRVKFANILGRIVEDYIGEISLK